MGRWKFSLSYAVVSSRKKISYNKESLTFIMDISDYISTILNHFELYERPMQCY